MGALGDMSEAQWAQLIKKNPRGGGGGAYGEVSVLHKDHQEHVEATRQPADKEGNGVDERPSVVVQAQESEHAHKADVVDPVGPAALEEQEVVGVQCNNALRR